MPLSKEANRERNARRRADPAYQAQQAEWNKAWREQHGKTPERLARRAAQMRAYSKAHGTAEHHKARRKVRHEIEMGRMVRQPCEACGSTQTEAHHDDYSQPLMVRWLCRPHHRAHHAKATGSAS